MVIGIYPVSIAPAYVEESALTVWLCIVYWMSYIAERWW